MRCKEHITDLSSSAGVCATCLRERLLVIVAAQAQLSRAAESSHRKPDPPPLVFPRSVSPYVSRRKSDANNNGDAWIHHHQRFYSTPQVGPTYKGGSTATANDYEVAARSFKKKNRTFSLFSNLFRSRSDKFNSDEPSSSSSPSFMSAFFAVRRKKQPSSRASHVEEFGRLDRGMSSTIEAYSGDECDRLPSGVSAEASPRWKRTPTTAAARRARNGSRNNVSGLAFCMSPLVRASPNRHWNQKGSFSSEVSFTGDGRSPLRSQLANAAGFSANRSRKLADIAKFMNNHSMLEDHDNKDPATEGKSVCFATQKRVRSDKTLIVGQTPSRPSNNKIRRNIQDEDRTCRAREEAEP